ncbi:MAG TPA: Gfo/Idh/MocA family oxidoreductase [Candidatus Krumholzibacteria bacterium]|nr:Gfo/Idh/MocA family oxidoreductase [Candidatus Krumholzibacteria bacterium]
MLGVGVIGLGVHGLRYVRHVARDVPGMRLAAVCRRDPHHAERIGREWGVPHFTNPEALLEHPEVKAVVIVTPPPTHLSLATLALERGTPVLLEKPLTQVLDEAFELERIVQETGTPLLLAQTLRYNVALRLARDQLERIGPVRSLTASQRLPRTDLAWQNTETTHPLGSILNTGVHLYDLVRWLLGAEFERVYCQAHRVENPFHEDLFKVQATLRDSDTLVALEVAKCTQSRSANLEIVGQHGQLWVDYQEDQVVHVEGTRRTVLRPAQPEPTLPPLLAAFAHCIANFESMPITVRDGLRTLEIVEACYRSLAESRPEFVSRPHRMNTPRTGP